MNTTKLKKTLIRLLPYIILGLVCTNLGEAWRLSTGADYAGFLFRDDRGGIRESTPEPSSTGSSSGSHLRRRTAACSLPPW